jgi:hypothetical protein
MKMTETGFFGKQNYTTLFVIAKEKPEAIHVVFWIASGFVPRGRNDE